MLKTTLHPRDWGRMIEAIGLSFIIGGTLVLGIFVAKILFLIAPTEIAALAMTKIFRQYDKILAVVMALVLIGEIIQLKSGSWLHGFASRMRSLIALFMVSMVFCSTMFLNPKLEAFQNVEMTLNLSQQGAMALNHLHWEVQWMLQVEMILSVLVLVLLMLPVPVEKN